MIPPEFTQLPRAIAIDLDGTLLNSRSKISERNRTALENCINRKIPVIIATSRPIRTVIKHLLGEALAQKCSLVLMNGAVTMGTPPLSGSFREMLPVDIAREVIDFASSVNPKIRIAIEIDGYDFGASWTTDAATLWQRNAATPDMVVSIEEALTRNPCKIALGGGDITILGKQLEERFGNSLSIVWAKIENPLINITSLTATKPAALHRLLDPHGISLDNVIAFGDDFPDIEMLKSCGISVAMDNAFPEIKAICRYQTAGNDEDGVALVLEKMLKTG
jgi:Cof subfamily protein (haloacid dehalogenase superfamily)